MTPMNSTNSSFSEAVSRPVLRGLAIVLVTGLIAGPSTAGADDIVLRWNNTPVTARADFSVLVANTPIGSRAKVAVWRSGQELSLEVAVGERPMID